MATITTPVKIWGVEVLGVSDLNTYLGANIQALLDGRFLKIADTVLLGSSGAITFTVPAGYRHLMLEYQARGDAASVNTTTLLQFNGDTAADYDGVLMDGKQSATFASSETIGGTSIVAGSLVAASAPANFASQGTIHIANYGGTAFHKQLTATNGFKLANTTGNIYEEAISGFWRSAAAINAIKLFPASGNFITGSTFTLYGLM